MHVFLCLLCNWNRRADFYLYLAAGEHFQTSLSLSFLKLGTQKEVRPWTQTKLQHPPTPSSLDFIMCRSCAGFFSLFPAFATLVLSWFFGQSLQARSFFPPPLSYTGSLLLAVHFYSLPRAAPLIPSTALGVLLLILSSLLAYAGKTRRVASFKASPFYSFACIWSALPRGLYKPWQPCQTTDSFS